MKRYILIADAGATKTDWALANGQDSPLLIKTQGISPVHQDSAAIEGVLRNELLPQLNDLPAEVYFYGAGCTEEKAPVVARELEKTFPQATVEVRSDLWGAARALCGHDAGIACILGTGANSCYYDGTRVCQNTPPLGYILGDEGSGAVMGKNFVANVLKGLFPKDIQEAFYEETKLTQGDVIDRVYRQPLAGRFLASLTSVPLRHRDHPAIHAFLIEHFSKFIERNIQQYHHPELPLHIVGGITNSFRPELEEAAKQLGYTIGRTQRGPIDGLIDFHTQTN